MAPKAAGVKKTKTGKKSSKIPGIKKPSGESRGRAWRGGGGEARSMRLLLLPFFFSLFPLTPPPPPSLPIHPPGAYIHFWYVAREARYATAAV